MYKIVVDCFGGDDSPMVNVNGAIDALNESKNISLILSGDAEKIGTVLKEKTYDKSRVEIIDAKDVISCEELPTEAIKNKPESSMVKAFAALKEKGDALVSIGSTGALLVGSVLKIGRIKGVSRPALAPVLPTLNGGGVVFLDAGANADCKEINLLHFAVMGSVYAENVLKIEKPKVALLSNGPEEVKGNELTKSVHAQLKTCKEINFIGNIEARDILSGIADVVVTDGFSGNIAIKSMEAVAGAVFGKLKEEIYDSFSAKIGALFMKKSLKAVKNTLDYNKKGGAVFLGIDKVIIKSHGSSKASAVKAAVLQAEKACENNLNGGIFEALSQMKNSGEGAKE